MIYFLILQGLPQATTSSGISLVTIEPAPMIVFFPIVIPSKI